VEWALVAARLVACWMKPLGHDHGTEDHNGVPLMRWRVSEVRSSRKGQYKPFGADQRQERTIDLSDRAGLLILESQSSYSAGRSVKGSVRRRLRLATSGTP